MKNLPDNLNNKAINDNKENKENIKLKEELNKIQKENIKFANYIKSHKEEKMNIKKNSDNNTQINIKLQKELKINIDKITFLESEIENLKENFHKEKKSSSSNSEHKSEILQKNNKISILESDNIKKKEVNEKLLENIKKLELEIKNLKQNFQKEKKPVFFQTNNKEYQAEFLKKNNEKISNLETDLFKKNEENNKLQENLKNLELEMKKLNEKKGIDNKNKINNVEILNKSKLISNLEKDLIKKTEENEKLYEKLKFLEKNFELQCEEMKKNFLMSNQKINEENFIIIKNLEEKLKKESEKTSNK